MNTYWINLKFTSSAWLDTMHTWSVAADWDTAADCSKVKKATREAAVFGNRHTSEAKPLWPAFPEIFRADPRPDSTPLNTRGEHFGRDDWKKTITDSPREPPFDLPHHIVVFNRNPTMRDEIFDTWKHELSHYAGCRDEDKADSLESCATRNEEREDSIWREKNDTTKKPKDRGGGAATWPTGQTETFGNICGHCTYERKVTCFEQDDGDTWCIIQWVLDECVVTGVGPECDRYAYAPLDPPWGALFGGGTVWAARQSPACRRRPAQSSVLPARRQRVGFGLGP